MEVHMLIDGGFRRPTPPPPPKPAIKHAAHKPAAHAAKPKVTHSFHADGFDKTVAHGSFDKSVALRSASGKVGNSNLGASGDVAFLTAGAKGNGSVSVGLNGVGARGSLSAEADLFEASGKAHANYGFGSTTASGHAFVGAEAKADGGVQIDPLHGTVDAKAGVDAFAGAKAEADVKQTLGPASAKAGVEGYAGVGVKADANVGLDHGKLEFKADLGAALGIGGGFSFSGSLDVGGAAHDVASVASKGWHALTSIF
jgi:hypothetical protein